MNAEGIDIYINYKNETFRDSIASYLRTLKDVKVPIRGNVVSVSIKEGAKHLSEDFIDNPRKFSEKTARRIRHMLANSKASANDYESANRDYKNKKVNKLKQSIDMFYKYTYNNMDNNTTYVFTVGRRRRGHGGKRISFVLYSMRATNLQQ